MSEHDPLRPPAVLAVDDTPENLELLTDLLAGYDISVALDGVSALALANEHRFDLILLDIMMPEMDGFEVCKRLKDAAATRAIPIIFITALSDEASIERAFALGGVDYVTKPFRPAELRARVRTHLQLYAMHTRLNALVENETRRRRLQERLLQRQSRMAAMGEMLDAVAHQWNQPLGVIALQTDLLGMEADPVPHETVAAYCETFRTQVEHMQNTLYDFRHFLRSDGGTVPVNTRELIEKLRTLMRGPLLNAHVSLVVEGVAPEARLFGNASELLHVLINLVANALDAFKAQSSADARTIRFAQQEHADTTVLQIEDNAGGIPAAILPSLFEPDVSGKPLEEGGGIGLFMSRRILEKHGGTIVAENTGTGARFTIALPLS